MYPGQLFACAPVSPEIRSSINEILLLAREIVNHRHLERKFMVFPLFMAGFAAETASDRSEALELLTALEQETMGRVANASRELLQLVFDKQNERLLMGNSRWKVDWVQVAVESGMQIVNCRL